MTRFVLLDFDGVICWAGSYRKDPANPRREDGAHLLDPACVARVQRICDATGAAIVLSTSWRVMGFERVTALLRVRGLTAPVVDMTPDEPESNRMRDEEIAEWMTRRGVRPDQVVILDDDPIAPPLAWRWVESNFGEGITDAHVEEAIGMFDRDVLALTVA
jgi:hypothetical protein